jgi:ATP-dependent RNA helicase SUPV3L1/SUV3
VEALPAAAPAESAEKSSVPFAERKDRQQRQDRHERQQRIERQGQRVDRKTRSDRDRPPRRDKGDRVERAEREQYYAKPFGGSENRNKQPDPNSPFAKLAALKQQLEQNTKES